jgi:sulfopropanediol 3-dehydrogenase
MEIRKAGGSRVRLEPDPEVSQIVARILSEIREEGEVAVRRNSSALDDWGPDSFVLSDDEVDRLCAQVPDALKGDIDYAAHGIRRFAQAQRETLGDLDIELRPNVFAGHRRLPVDRAAAYTPGGRFQLITTALMSVLPAVVAGVPEVTAIIAPARGKGPLPAAVYAARVAGATRICSIGGVQALGAFAYGALDGIEQVDILVGPGNVYVAEAKRQLFGTVGIDLLAGPSEILILADDSADPLDLAWDLISQAEHGPTSATALVTDSTSLAAQVETEIGNVLADLPTADIASVAWRDYGSIAVAEGREEMAAAADDYGSEHILLDVEEPDWFHQRLRNYGGIFLNRWSGVIFGDKANGPNSTLPTLRAARYTGGLGVEKFMKTLTYQRVEPAGLEELIEATAGISRAEGMIAHAIAAERRRQPQASGTSPVGVSR